MLGGDRSSNETAVWYGMFKRMMGRDGLRLRMKEKRLYPLCHHREEQQWTWYINLSFSQRNSCRQLSLKEWTKVETRRAKERPRMSIAVRKETDKEETKANPTYNFWEGACVWYITQKWTQRLIQVLLIGNTRWGDVSSYCWPLIRPSLLISMKSMLWR